MEANNFQVVRLAQEEHKINKLLGRVESSKTKFSSGIIVRKSVVVIVVPFAEGAERDEWILTRFNFGVVGPFAKHVSS